MDIFKGNIETCSKRQAYNTRVLSTMTYGSETWALTTQAKKPHKQIWKAVYIKHHTPGQKNVQTYLGKGTDKGRSQTGLNNSEDGYGLSFII